MHDFVSNVGHALLLAFGMFWKTGWSLVLGFTISAALQAFVSTDQIRRVLGRDDCPRDHRRCGQFQLLLCLGGHLAHAV